MSEHSPEPGQPEREVGHERRSSAESPRIWIGSLADYNAGTLHGDWVDAATDEDALIEAAKAIVDRSETPGAEEWAIFDYDGFGDWKPGEYEDLTVVARVARGISEHGLAFSFWAEFHDADPQMLDSFSEAYLGEYDSAEAWAEIVARDMDLEAALDRAIPDAFRNYVNIDYEAIARDAWLSGDIYLAHRPGGGVWIFDARL